MARLTDEAYKLTIGEPMAALTPADLDRPIALGDYLDAIDPDDLDGHDFGERAIDNVFRDPSEQFIHVSFRCKTRDVFLVVVVETRADAIYGHHLLDLRQRGGRRARLLSRRRAAPSE